MTPRPRVLNAFPHPIAVPYSLAFDESLAASDRRWALCFTQYQVLRLVVLAHASQYLRDDIDTTAKAAVKAANEQIAGLKSPMFSNWVTAVRTLPRQWPALKLSPPFPDLVERLKKLPSVVRPVPDSSGATKLPPLEAIVALRNNVAHGGIPDQKQAERHLAEYLPTLCEVLTAFDFLADCRLLVCDDAEKAKQGLPVAVRTLRGVTPPEPEEVELSPELEAAFGESPAVLVTPAGVPIPLDPLLRPLPHDEPLYLYDGHYGIRVTAKTEAVNRYVYYLGVRDKRSGTPECQAAAERLRELLAARHISYDLPKERVHPWTIAEAALEYSRRTVADLLGTKYFPECYEPFPQVDDHLDRFLTVPDRKDWKDTTRPRFRNGLLLLGTAGSGKTALLARRVERLLARPTSADAPADPEADRGNPNVVLFLRGNGIALRPDGVSLFRDVAEKLGVSVGEKGVGSFDELFAHLHTGFVKDQVPGRRLVLVFDALNEAPFAEQITREALQLVSLAARFPWCKVVLSTRDEWLAILPEKMTATEADPRAEARDHLYDPDPTRPPDQRRLPAVYLEPLSADHAERIYRRQQERARTATQDGYAIPACATPWDGLPEGVRKLLTNPLYLYLFQRAFAGRPVGAVAGVPELYAAYVESAYERNIGPAVRAVVEHLCDDPDRTTADLTDDDVNALRLKWNAGRTAAEIRTDFHPAEMLVHEGFVTKRVREEGGGYRFVYQTVAEYLIYRHLRDEMPPGGDEFAYWLTLAKREKAFPEYAGAVLFLFRQLPESRWADLVRLVEQCPGWVSDQFGAFLTEVASEPHPPGRESAAAGYMAQVITDRDRGVCNSRIADALTEAAHRLMHTPHYRSALRYLRMGVGTLRELVRHQPAPLSLMRSFASALANLGQLSAVYLDEAGADGTGGEIALGGGGSARPADGRSDPAAHLEEAVSAFAAIVRDKAADRKDRFAHAMSLNNLGMFRRNRGESGLARAVFRAGLDAYRRLSAEFELDPQVAKGHAMLANNFANLLTDVGDEMEGERLYREGIRVADPHHRRNPLDKWLNLERLSCMLGLALLLSRTRRVAEGDDWLNRAITDLDTLHRTLPDDFEVGNTLAQALNNRGLRLDHGGDAVAAVAVYRRVIAIRQSLAKAYPDQRDNRDGLGMAWLNLGVMHSRVGERAEEIGCYEQSIAIREPLYDQDPDDITRTVGLGNTYTNLFQELHRAGRVEEATRVIEKGLRLWQRAYTRNPDNIDVLFGAGTVLFYSGNLPQAEALFAALLRVEPGNESAALLLRLIRSRS